MAEDRLTDDEVARVLRRAAELDGSESSAVGGDGLPVAAVEAAAAEVGLAPTAVRQAVAELRAGALDNAATAPDHVVCARVVPGDCTGCLESVARYLGGQVFVRARDRGTEQVWRPREDFFARMQRRMDFTAAIRLKTVDEVIVRGVEVEGGTLVRVVARLQPSTASAPSIGTGVGVAAGGLAAATLGFVDPVLLLAAVPGAAGGGALGWRVGHGVRGREQQKVADAIEGMLDELELGRTPGTRRSLDRLAERARRLRTGYRL